MLLVPLEATSPQALQEMEFKCFMKGPGFLSALCQLTISLLSIWDSIVSIQ
jgi:hypothetical protein